MQVRNAKNRNELRALRLTIPVKSRTVETHEHDGGRDRLTALSD